jgi:hypothetical protein
MSETEENSKRYELGERTLQFARDVRAFIKMLPRTVANDEDTRQLVRALMNIFGAMVRKSE